MFWQGWEGEALAAFSYQLLKSHNLSAPATILSDKRIRAFNGWGKCESGADGSKAAKNNPCGTSQKMPGSKDFNSAGVQNYLTRFDGIRAMALMLNQPNMLSIRAALVTEPFSLKGFADAVIASPWGTDKACLYSVYGLKQ
jgi:hypothetical protein